MTQVIENIGGEYRNRTGVHGFAIRCVTTPPTRQSGGLIRRNCRFRQADISGAASRAARSHSPSLMAWVIAAAQQVWHKPHHRF